MKKFTFILCFFAFIGAKAQDFTSLATGGAWNSPLLTWGVLTLTPGSGDDVLITAPGTVTVDGNRVCRNLEINGTVQLNSLSTLSVENDIEVNNGGTLNVNSGTVVTQGLDMKTGGTLTINAGNQVEVEEFIATNGASRWIINDGSVIIYSNITF